MITEFGIEATEG